MIDPDVDPERAANTRAEEFAARRARRRALLATGEPPQGRNVGHLVALPSAPPSADAGTLTETVAVESVPPDNVAPAENAAVVFGSTTQLIAAAVLVAVLLAAWFAERRSARKGEEVDHG